jgi:mannosyltransferase
MADFRPEVIVLCLKRRYSGVTATVSHLLPVQSRDLMVGYVGPEIAGSAQALREQPDRLRYLTVRQAIAASRQRLPDGRRVIWHVRRDTEMLLALIVRDVLRCPIHIIFTSAASWQHGKFLQWLIGRMDGVIAVSDRAAEHVPTTAVKYLMTPAVVMHGVPLDHLQPPPEPLLEGKAAAWAASGLPGRYGIGIFGRVRESKGVHVFVDALIEVLPKYPEFTAFSTGLCQSEDQAYLDAMKAKLHAAGLSDRMVWLGERPADEIPQWFQRALITVACSIREGFGLTPIEGMAAGCAVASSRAGAFEQMVVDGQTGFITETGDAASLAHALDALMRDTARTAEMGRAGRERAMEKFSIEAEAQGIAAVYRALWQRA